MTNRARVWSAAAVAILLTGAAASVQTGAAATHTVAAVGPVLACFAGMSTLIARREWFHPYVFPFAYASFALLLPPLYLVLFNRPIDNLRPALVTETLVWVFGLTLLGVVAGVAAGVRFPSPLRMRPGRSIDLRRLRQVGLLSLLLALPARGYWLSTRIGRPYGESQFEFGLAKTLDNVAVALFLVGVILTVTANLRRSGRLAGPPEIALATAFVLLTLGSGNRGELIAPVLFVAWAWHTWVRRIPALPAAVLCLAVLVIFQGVSGVRSGEGAWAGGGAMVERTLTAVGVPLAVTSAVISVVPDPHPHRWGSTYVAALKRQLPSPIANRLFGTPDDTGSFVLREVTGFRNPDQGQGFALPAEGYLNFGVAGALSAALLAGALLGFAWRMQAPVPTRAAHLLYPVLLTAAPYGLRADALAQVKLVLYPLLLLVAAFWLSRFRGARRVEEDEPPALTGSRLQQPVTRGALTGVLAAVVLLPAALLAYSLLREPLISASAGTRTVSIATGMRLVEGAPAPVATGIDRTFTGGDAMESVVLVVCFNGDVAERLAQPGQIPGRDIGAIRQDNVVVYYARDSAAPDHSGAIRDALAGQRE